MLRSRWTRRMVVPGAVAALVGALAVVVPASPAAAATAITVTPSTNLVQGQTVSVSGTGYPANATVGIIQCAAGAQTISDCEFRYNTAAVNASGAFTNATFTVNQVISTDSHGVLNCAVDACVIAVGTFPDQQNVALAPITMTNTLGPPSYTLEPNGTAYLDPGGRVNASANVVCHVTGPVAVFFRSQQNNASSSFSPPAVNVDCTAGTTVRVISDYLDSGSQPGPITLVVWTTSGAYPVEATATVTLQSAAQAQAALSAALQGPNGAQVFAQLIDDLRFRILHNPIFAHEFFVAILQALAAG